VGCHTEPKGVEYAGGRALKTPFGIFYSPNITPDPTHGIGRWSDADFLRALKHGISPRGWPYYPAFPYTSFSGISYAVFFLKKKTHGNQPLCGIAIATQPS